MKFNLPQCGRGGALLLLLWLVISGQAQAQTPDWQTALAAVGDVQVQASTTDGSGNVYLAGGFAGTATFGTTTLSTTNGQEAFVAKWNPATGFAWALKGTSSSSTGRSLVTAIAVSSPYVFIAGNFVSQTLTLGSRPALTNAQTGTSDIFLARITDTSTNGVVGWAKRAGGVGNDYAGALTNLFNSLLYLGGTSGGNATFDNYTLAGAGGFVARYQSGSSAVATSPAPVVLAGDAVTALSLGGNSIYAAGTFNNAAAAVPGGTLVSAGGEDLFVLKLSYLDVTARMWVQQAGGSGDDYARCLLTTGGGVYVGGSYRSSSAAFGSITLPNAGASNLFVSKLTDAGTSASFAWALPSGGTSTDPSNSANALSLYGNSLYVAGTFGGTASFGSRTLSSAGSTDALVAKLTDRGSSASFVGAQQAGGSGPDVATGIVRLNTRTWVATGQVTAPATFGSLSLGTGAGVRPGFVATLLDPAPLLTLVAPNVGPVGTSVTLYGEGLTGTTAVAFAGTSNNVVTSGFTVNAAGTQISGVVVPAGAQSGTVEVTTPVGTSNGLVGFTVAPTNAAPAWQSVVAAGSSSLIRWAAPAAGGTVIVAGEFSGSIALGGTTLTSAGTRDIFVAKFNPSTGGYVWAVRAGSASDEDTYGGVSVSGSSIYLAGQFYGSSIAFGGTTLNAPFPGLAGYVAKLTDAGNSASFTWAQQLLDDGSGVYVEALTSNGNNVYVGGDFTGSALTIAGVTALSTNESFDDGYVAKLIDNGSTSTFAWVSRIGNANNPLSSNTMNVYGLSANGNTLYVSGVFYGALNFGNSNLSTNYDSGDIGVARLTDNGSSGTFTSALQAGGTANEFVYSMSRQGNVLYISGSTTSTNWPGATLTGTGVGFVAKVTDTGGTLGLNWVQLLNSTVYQTVPNGTGVYAATSLVGAATLGGTALQSAGLADGLVVRLADGGNSVAVSWARTAGGLYADGFRTLALASGQVVVAGSVTPLAAFGTTVVASPIGVPVAALGTLADPAILAVAAAQPREPLALYPNPAHDRTSLRLPAAGAGPLQLFDAMGREVRRYAAPAGTPEITLDLRGLPAGVYVVRAGLSSRQLLVE